MKNMTPTRIIPTVGDVVNFFDDECIIAYLTYTHGTLQKVDKKYFDIDERVELSKLLFNGNSDKKHVDTLSLIHHQYTYINPQTFAKKFLYAP